MENEIKVGEYVRTKEGYIGKLVEYIPNALNYLKIDVGREIIHCDNSRDNFIYTRYGFQLEHSPNLIDIIQKDDFVNKCRVFEVEEKGITVYQTVENSATDYNWISFDEIEEIVTKEMMESISYKVKE